MKINICGKITACLFFFHKIEILARRAQGDKKNYIFKSPLKSHTRPSN